MLSCRLPVGWGALVALAICQPLVAQWTAVGNGIEYREYTLPDPNRVFVARMSRANPACALESMIGTGKLYSGLERVTGQADRYDDAINYVGEIWGQRNDVVVAINGDFWNTSTSRPTNGQIQSGWHCWRFMDWGGWGAMAYKLDGSTFMGGCIHYVASDQIVTYLANGQTQPFDGINVPRGTNNLVVYTHHWDSNTHTDSTGVEVLVEMSRPLLILPYPNMVTGTIREIRQNQGSSYIPFDHVVLSATGSKATALLANASVGAQVGFSQLLKDYVPAVDGAPGCSMSSGYDWTKTYAAVGGNFTFLRNGYVPTPPASQGGLLYDDPRTAVAYNDDYIFFLVVDGRQPGYSIGMTAMDLANFCTTYLGATWGYNMDGGGSSAMVVNGVLKNRPSDGSERLVANGLAMINVLPKQQSAIFRPGDGVKTIASTSLRLGPGTNFASFASLSSNASGIVQSHSMAGVYAKGQNWWKCNFNGSVGWVQESSLSLPNTPVILSHPLDQALDHGGTINLSVEATGTAPLSYQWQKDGIDLADGGRRSGVLTPALTIIEATGSDNGAYRCRVSNPYDAVTSNEALVKVRSPDMDRDDDVDMDDFGILQACFTGSGEELTDPACERAKLDSDSDIDGEELNRFKKCLAGPGVLPPPTCMQ